MTEKKTRENYTRVTNILYPFSGLDKINPYRLSNAARRGSKVHNICEGIIHGLGEIGVDEETAPYINSFKKWWANQEVLMIEQRFWDDELEITGQVDLILNTSEGLTLIDFKTSSTPSKTWQAQGSAYGYLARKNGHDIKKICFIHLSKKGLTPDIYEYPVDDSFFLAVWRVWNHFFYKN